jgi:hypothetical protein
MRPSTEEGLMNQDPTLYGDSGAGAIAGIFSGVMGLVYFAVLVLVIVAMWKVFTKAGEPGWYSIIPIWSTLVLLKIVGRPMWWILLMFIPLVNLVILIIVYNDLSKSFGKGVGFTVGLILLPFIFMLILGFGGATYVGPGGIAAAPAVPPAYQPPPAPPSA